MLTFRQTPGLTRPTKGLEKLRGEGEISFTKMTRRPCRVGYWTFLRPCHAFRWEVTHLFLSIYHKNMIEFTRPFPKELLNVSKLILSTFPLPVFVYTTMLQAPLLKAGDTFPPKVVFKPRLKCARGSRLSGSRANYASQADDLVGLGQLRFETHRQV